METLPGVDPDAAKPVAKRFQGRSPDSQVLAPRLPARNDSRSGMLGRPHLLTVAGAVQALRSGEPAAHLFPVSSAARGTRHGHLEAKLL